MPASLARCEPRGHNVGVVRTSRADGCRFHHPAFAASRLRSFGSARARLEGYNGVMQHSSCRVFVLASLFALACSAADRKSGIDGGSAGSGSSSGGALSLATGHAGGGQAGNLNLADTSKLPAPAGCGDGVLTPDEACDDGNQVDMDGCFANCLGVDAGFTCPKPGEACRPFARC